MTIPIDQSEEAYMAAVAIKEQYGDMIMHVSYPVNWVQEQETTVSTMLGLAADPKVKAIVTCESVVGTAAAFEKVREVRPDMLLVATLACHDDPSATSNAADIGYDSDNPMIGRQMVEAAVTAGAETLVFYSFPRHMSIVTMYEQRVMAEQVANELGINFVFETSPDPRGDAGVAGSQQFILEDVPRKVKEYGRDTMFYSTNIGQAEPIIKAVLAERAIYSLPSDPSPFAAFPGGLGIEVPEDRVGDVDFMFSEISRVLAENDMTGRMGTWNVPVSTLYLTAGFEYALAWCKGEFTERNDYDQLVKAMMKVANGEEVGVRVFFDEGVGADLPNFYLILGSYIFL